MIEQGIIAKGVINGVKEMIDNMSNIAEILVGD